ncbi:MAG: hypothetical protein JWO59_2541, partial [Chloroflexi bacterium]|nr:hypothetical protein [Chloroflexota bacterium]
MGVSSLPSLKQAVATSSIWQELLSFFGQIALVASVELADEFARGMIAQSDSRVGALHATDVVRFETAHGFWVEPQWQLFFEHTHRLLGLAIHWAQIIPIANGIYLFGHILITFLFAFWMFFFRR